MILLLSILSLCTFGISDGALTEEELKSYLKGEYEKEASEWCSKANGADFDFNIDLKNEEKKNLVLNISLGFANFEKMVWKKYFKDLNPDDIKDENLKRQAKMLKVLGSAALPPAKVEKLTEVINKMTEIYSVAKVCPYEKQDCDLTKEGLSLDPHLEQILTTSRNTDQLKYAWKAWRDASGAKMRDLFKEYVDLVNEVAKANGFSDGSTLWQFPFETPNFEQEIDKIWKQVEPLYNELHQYVARKLKKFYGDAIDVSDGLIPAHVLGNMWAQSWVNIFDIVKPYPKATTVNVTQAMLEQKYTVKKMFEMGNDFYTSMGLEPVAVSYGPKAMIEKPKDGREVVCHASAWDFCTGKDFRIKMCTNINDIDFVTIHHEMGHIEYYLLYKHQPITYRSGANPGFHEAVGDTIALSFETPKHLHRIGLLKENVENREGAINHLMQMALKRIGFLPFGLLIDKWRWDIFSGKVQPNEWNAKWWYYREKYQKLKPPVPRSDPRDFDAGAKFHIPSDSKYISYFIAHIAEFQFYKSLCIAAGEYDPTDKTGELHKCDFYGSKAAGDKLRAGLSLGSSKHWTVAMEAITGQKNLDAGPILEYFKPLYEFLKTENSKRSL